MGDALGEPVEFMSLDGIRQAYGPAGIIDLPASFGLLAPFTDDTQMTLFVAEGLADARALSPRFDREVYRLAGYRALLRWLVTQEKMRPPAGSPDKAGTFALVQEPALYRRMAPGMTCLFALESGRVGNLDDRLNDSKGCGGRHAGGPDRTCFFRADRAGFPRSRRSGGPNALPPTGYLKAGHFALTIRYILEGLSLEEAIKAAMAPLDAWPDPTDILEIRQAITQAVELAG